MHGRGWHLWLIHHANQEQSSCREVTEQGERGFQRVASCGKVNTQGELAGKKARVSRSVLARTSHGLHGQEASRETGFMAVLASEESLRVSPMKNARGSPSSASIDSHLPPAQSNPSAPVAHFGVACSDVL